MAMCVSDDRKLFDGKYICFPQRTDDKNCTQSQEWAEIGKGLNPNDVIVMKAAKKFAVFMSSAFLSSYRSMIVVPRRKYDINK